MTARRVISHGTVVRGGERYFLLHSTIDMDRLAEALAVSRATLYRVAGGRDRLLGDVLWRLGARLLAESRTARTRPGVDGIIEVTRRFAGALLRADAFRRFLAAEPDTAARVLFTPAGRVHERAVAAQKEIFLEVAGPGRWAGTDLDQVAYLYVRMVESALYAELLNGHQPDLDLAEQALRALVPPAR